MSSDNLQIRIGASSSTFAKQAAEDVFSWWSTLESHERSDYLSSIDSLVPGEIIYLDDYKCVFQEWSDQGWPVVYIYSH